MAFATQYSVYCASFPRCLAAVAANVPDDATRSPLIENLWEEHGEGEISRSHRALYERFATALDIPGQEKRENQALPTTRQYVDELFDLCHSEHFLIGLGALGPGTELFTSQEYESLFAGLIRYDFLSEYDLEFFKAHIGLDDTHYAEMLEAILPWAEDVAHQERIRHGAERAVRMEAEFWDGLEQHIYS